MKKWERIAPIFFARSVVSIPNQHEGLQNQNISKPKRTDSSYATSILRRGLTFVLRFFFV